jgi:hypothetical protein
MLIRSSVGPIIGVQATQDHCMNDDNIEIMDTANNHLKLCINQLLLILKKQPYLKKQLISRSDFDTVTDYSDILVFS